MNDERSRVEPKRPQVEQSLLCTHEISAYRNIIIFMFFMRYTVGP